VRPERRLDGRGVFDAHERAVTRPEQELGIDERAKERIALGGFEPPHPTRLRAGQAQARHFQKLTLHSPV